MSMEQLSRPVTQPPGSLPEQLDDAIGEASTGIGVMLSELVRRSLKGGVANIDQTLQGFAESQVHTAVEQQMPHLTEAASTVAESTSVRLIQEQVTPTVDKLTGQVQAFEGKLETETERLGQRFTETAADTARRLQESSVETERRLNETAAEADRRINETSEHLGSLKENARTKWKKLVAELDSLSSANRNLNEQVSSLQQQLSEAATSQQQLVQQFQSESAAQANLLQEQNQRLEARLVELEKPKGLKGMWQKIAGGKKKAPDSELT
ncbi:MAG: hypothetical protein ABJZ55_18350 [Fuerstiella sp.]